MGGAWRIRLGPNAARASHTGLCADVPHLGNSGNGPSREPVSRCLTLKGSFEGGVHLDQTRSGAAPAMLQISIGFVVG